VGTVNLSVCTGVLQLEDGVKNHILMILAELHCCLTMKQNNWI